MSLVISLVTSSYLKPPQTLSAVIDLPYPTLFCPRRRLPKTLRPSCNTSRKVASVAVTHLTTTRNAAVHPKGLKFVISLATTTTSLTSQGHTLTLESSLPIHTLSSAPYTISSHLGLSRSSFPPILEARLLPSPHHSLSIPPGLHAHSSSGRARYANHESGSTQVVRDRLRSSGM